MNENTVNYIELVVYKTLFTFSRSLTLKNLDSLKENARSMIHIHIKNNIGTGLLKKKYLQDYLDLADRVIEIALSKGN